MTEQDWQAFLRAIAEKAKQAPKHRFVDLYRQLNQDVLRLCFYRLRKAAASGVDRVMFQAYLEVAPDKTKTLRFGHNGGPHNGRLDFPGVEFYLEPDRKGQARVKRRTATKKWRAGLQRMKEWIKGHRHEKLSRLMQTLKSKLRGTWKYYGLIGNSKRMGQFHQETRRTVFKWLNRRCQRKSMTWPAFDRLLARFQVPPPRIVEKNIKRTPCQQELSFCQRILEVQWPKVHLPAHARVS